MDYNKMSREGSRQEGVIDALEVERRRFNSMQQSSLVSSKNAMQQLYKKQLDTLLEEKVRLKQAERTRQELQKREFNELVEKGKESEKNKEQSYKNYYNMLMNSQLDKQQSYVSPFSKRDNLKEALINKGIDQDRQRYLQIEQEMRQREAQKRNSYRNQLLQQIEERKQKQFYLKNSEVRQKEAFQRNSKVPSDIERYEKEKKKQQIEKYREDLDLMTKGMDRSEESRRQSTGSGYLVQKPEYHNILTNPLPYNIQNPYILKQMSLGSNPSYLAMKGSQNLKLS